MRSGLVALDPLGKLQRFTHTNGLSSSAVRCVMEDRERNLWVGSGGGGLMRLRPRTFFSYGLDNGLPNPVVKAVAEQTQERILIGTYGAGVARLEGGKITRLTDGTGQTFDDYVQSLLVRGATERSGWEPWTRASKFFQDQNAP